MQYCIKTISYRIILIKTKIILQLLFQRRKLIKITTLIWIQAKFQNKAKLKSEASQAIINN